MGVQRTSASRKRRAAQLRAQERRWAAKAGPVVVRQATAEELERMKK